MMDKTKTEQLTENTIIGSRKITAAEFRKFFKKTLGEDYEKYPVAHNVIKVSLNYRGKTLKEILDECYNPSKDKNLDELLAESRFNLISETNKSFIIAFDKAMNGIGYDFGGSLSGNSNIMAITYGKTGTKTRPRPARIHIHNDGKIDVKLYLHKIDNHRKYIENASPYIKDLFTNNDNKCTGCNFRDGKCKYNNAKIYTIDGKLIHKCDITLNNPTIEKLQDYIKLIMEFYSRKIIQCP